MAKRAGRLAQRYAKALLRTVEGELGKSGEPSPAQQLASGLRSFAMLWLEERELSSSLLNPMFPKNERLRALLALAEHAALPQIARNFLRVVFERDRIAVFPEIAQAFALLADEAAAVVRVKVTVAREIPGEEVRSIQLDLRHRIPGKPEFSWAVEPAILGGLIVEYAGKVLDGSLSGQLNRIERKLLG